jgi:S-adenosylmethionine:tRNA ribosyltransferase-isomerase
VYSPARVKLELLSYELPEAQIAAYPTQARDGARLLVVQNDGLQHRQIVDFPDLVPERSLLVLNETRVRRARWFGQRSKSGGKVELLFLRRLPDVAEDKRERWQAIGRASKPLRIGSSVEGPGLVAEVIDRDQEGMLILAVSATPDLETVLEQTGRLPIPPYLGRDDEALDSERYQTVFANRTGSAAAPTAGLHLSKPLLARLEARNVEIARIELEVGLGTFKPVTVEDLDSHPMHSEHFVIPELAAEQIERARERGSKVIAVGTTAVRALESAADRERRGLVRAMRGDTRLLIQPGYDFHVVDGLLTNFHMPKSTLLALVSAFAGYSRIMHAYREALSQNYRFLSYGDAMWLPERLSC